MAKVFDITTPNLQAKGENFKQECTSTSIKRNNSTNFWLHTRNITNFICFQEIQLELGDRLDLSSYLLEPVQRIPRYKLFLADLVKTYSNYENEKCETDSRISKLSVDSDETGGSNGESSDNEETPLESLKLAKTMIECVLTAVDEIMALENITDCPVSEVYIT